MENLRGSLQSEEAAGRKFRRMSSRVLRACSACAGDYEDPDRTAPRDDEDVDEVPDEVAFQDLANVAPENDANDVVNRDSSGESRKQGAAEPVDAEEIPGRKLEAENEKARRGGDGDAEDGKEN